MATVLEQQELERAIATLQVHRAILGDVAADTAVSTLQEKLLILQNRPGLEEHPHIIVLVADLSGFTAMSEFMDAEEVRDTVNALWKRLDNTITSWGGRVDKHTGDGLIALFGLLNPDDRDAERAIQAALDMQMELKLYNEGWMGRQHPVLQMRIGIHCGPLFLGKVGSSEAYTAVGETVTVANRVQELAAPIGGILITQDVQNHVEALFEMIPWEATKFPLVLYEVKQERRQSPRLPRQELFQAHLVGRTSEMEQLQQALDDVLHSGTSHTVTLVGPAGVGKSRLLEEFERWLHLQPTAVILLKGCAYQSTGQWPYTLLHDIFANLFAIHMPNSPAVRRAKLEQGILTVLKENNQAARQQAHIIGEVAGFDFGDSPHIQAELQDAQRLQKAAFQSTIQLLRAGTVDTPAVLLLEDLQWADEGSLAWIDWLMQECRWMPLLLVCTARPELYEKRPSWKTLDSLAISPVTNIQLEPLSSINSRHLVGEWLQKIPYPPIKLTDLTVVGGQGNPYALEQWLYYWVDSGIITQLPGRWQLQPGRLNEVRIPVSLAALLRGRLEQLPVLERQVLQQAAVVGRLFWESAVSQLAQKSDPPVSAGEVQKTLRLLTQKGILEMQRTSLFPGQQEYLFQYDSWRDVAYATLPGVQQRVYHAQAANWLEAQAGSQVGRFAALLAGQHEGAGQMKQAAEWYGRAADEALTRNELETAVRHYRHGLRLLGDAEPALRVALNEKLARLHRLQASFPATAVIYAAMEPAARDLNDPMALSRALQGLFWAQVFLERWEDAGQTVQRAETAARATGSLTEELALALMAKGWVAHHREELEDALAFGKEALSIGTAVSALRGTAFSHLLLGKIYGQQKQWGEAQQMMETAVTLFQEMEDLIWVGMSLGEAAEVAQAEGKWETAETLTQQALQNSRAVGDIFGTILSLKRLGQLAAQRRDKEQAETCWEQALALAERANLPQYQTALIALLQGQTRAW